MDYSARSRKKTLKSAAVKCVDCSAYKTNEKKTKKIIAELRKQNKLLDKKWMHERTINPDFDDVVIKYASIEEENGALLKKMELLKDKNRKLKDKYTSIEYDELLEKMERLKDKKRQLKKDNEKLLNKIVKLSRNYIKDSDESDSDE